MTESPRPFRLRGALIMALFMAPLLVPCLATCSGIGAGYLAYSSVRLGHVEAQSLTDRSAVPDDAFLEFEATGVLIATADRMYGSRVFDIDGAPNVILLCDGECESGGRLEVQGRMCDPTALLPVRCDLPPGFDSYLAEEAERRGLEVADLRVVLAPERGIESMVFAVLAFAVAALVLLVHIGVAYLGGRSRVGPARVQSNVTWQVPLSVTEVRERVRRLGDDARMLKDAPDEIVIEQGRTEFGTRLLGVRDPSQVARRLVIRLRDHGAYQSTQVDVTMEEALLWFPSLTASLSDLCTRALERSRKQLDQALG